MYAFPCYSCFHLRIFKIEWKMVISDSGNEYKKENSAFRNTVWKNNYCCLCTNLFRIISLNDLTFSLARRPYTLYWMMSRYFPRYLTLTGLYFTIFHASTLEWVVQVRNKYTLSWGEDYMTRITQGWTLLVKLLTKVKFFTKFIRPFASSGLWIITFIFKVKVYACLIWDHMPVARWLSVFSFLFCTLSTGKEECIDPSYVYHLLPAGDSIFFPLSLHSATLSRTTQKNEYVCDSSPSWSHRL
jgi:hypothetical protein